MDIQKGTLIKFSGSWGSGLGFLAIKDSKTGNTESIPCENGPTVRALEDAFGNTITAGHTASGEGYVGKEVYWVWDEFGLTLGGFTPVDEADGELEEKYQAQA